MFENPLTDRDMYWLGYLQADGGMVSKIGEEYKPGLFRKTGGYAQFAQVHYEPVAEFLAYIDGEGKVRVRENFQTNFGPCKSLYTVASSKPYHQLLQLGLKLRLREDIYCNKHFWRGLLDGDGSVKMVKNQGSVYPTICWSGNEYDMTKCSEWLEPLIGKLKVGKARSIFRVGTNGNKAKFLAEYLYKGEYSALPYKREEAINLMNWQPKRPNRSWHPI